MDPGESVNLAIVKALNDEPDDAPSAQTRDSPDPVPVTDVRKLADEYEYAYWLGYVYRCELQPVASPGGGCRGLHHPGRGVH